MHEFSLAERILECALELSATHEGAPVERIEVEIGALRAVVPDSLLFAFEAAAQETAAEGARLDWREVPAQVECRACQANYEPQDMIWSCPECGTVGGRAVHGDELLITRVVLGDYANARVLT
jgi:hydrogenase nickel incorporation protein HypA/HybF